MITIRIEKEKRTAIVKLEDFAQYVTSIDQGYVYLKLGNLTANTIKTFESARFEKRGLDVTEISFTEIAVGGWGFFAEVEGEDVIIYEVKESKVVVSE